MSAHSTYVFECPCGLWKNPMRLSGPVGLASCLKCRRLWSLAWDIEIRQQRAALLDAAQELRK